MLSLILVAALSCPEPKIVNRSSEPWNEVDAKVLESAKLGCKRFLEQPCLIRLEKVEQGVYNAICGKTR